MNHKFGNASSLHMQEQQVVTISNLGISGDSNWINYITTSVIIIISENRDRENHKLTVILYNVQIMQFSIFF